MSRRPILVMFVGVPGSGKTTFASQIAEALHAVLLNSDSLRFSMWGNLAAIREHHADTIERSYNNQLTFGALDYAAGQIIRSGNDVVYDCNANTREERRRMADVALRFDGVGIVVCIQTPLDVSARRLAGRRAADGQTNHSFESATAAVGHYSKQIEEPTTPEFTIEIDGRQDFQLQRQSFTTQLDVIVKKIGETVAI